MEQAPHLLLFQSPGLGHLIPIVEFAKRIISLHEVSSTIIVPTDGPISPSHMSYLGQLPQGIDYLLLPPVSLDGLVDAKPETRLSVTVSRSLPSLRDAIKSLIPSKRVVALVLDLFTTDAIEVAWEFNVSPFMFCSSSALSLAFLDYLPKLDATVKCEFRELPEPIRIPGCVPLHGGDLLDPVQDRKNEGYKWILHHSKRIKLTDGIILNTFEDLEGETLKALESRPWENEQGVREALFFPIGPLVQTTSQSDGTDGSGCLGWLDNQPPSSVVFVSFGSGGTLSYDQFTELALGLESSGQRFIWVIRNPNDKAANAAFFGTNDHDDPFAFLPEGYLERIKGRGLLVAHWAPQAAILGHVATGGFVTHCGWNSTLESVVNGAPLIAWPLYAEQKMNAVVLTDHLGVALRPKAEENGLVKRVEIANALRNLMEGKEGQLIRHRMRYLQDASVKALSEDGGSTKSLAALVAKWNTQAASLSLQ